MEEIRPSFRGPADGERRLGIVSGRGFTGSNQVYITSWPQSPDIPPHVTRPSQVVSSSSASSKPWGGFGDPEIQRRKRIAKYKVYSIEGRFKASIRNGFRWIKNKCSEIIHGY